MKKIMNSTLLAISWFVIGFSAGFMATTYFIVRPLARNYAKLEKVATEAAMNQINLILKVMGVPKKEADGSMVSPIQIQ